MDFPRLVTRVMQAKWFRASGFPRPEPLSLAVGVTSRCMSKCRTCNVSASEYDELAAEEYEKIFRKLNNKNTWLTITGGEPFLREDLADVVGLMVRHGKPDHCSIPTNGYLEDTVARTVLKIARSAPDTQFIVHVSIDGIGRAHDEIRSLPESFDRAMYTLASLKNLNQSNVLACVHTTISRFNADRIRDILRYVREFKPDAHHFEIAWPRKELNMEGADISPTVEQYACIVRDLLAVFETEPQSGTKALMRALRNEYYRMSARAYAEQRQIVPCFAGFASAHISPDGGVSECCTRKTLFGNLRENNYSLYRVWMSREADMARAEIRKGNCWCLLANTAYTNMLCDFGLARPWVLRAFAGRWKTA